MQLPTFLVSLALLATAIGTPVLAGGSEHGPQHERPSAARQRAAKNLAQEPARTQEMQVVPHDAAANAPGHGWRYFTNPAARRAVVISPQEDYYYSRGDGLRWVAARQF